MDYNLVATTTFGLEGITAKELKALGYEELKVENGNVHFSGDDIQKMFRRIQETHRSKAASWKDFE